MFRTNFGCWRNPVPVIHYSLLSLFSVCCCPVAASREKPLPTLKYRFPGFLGLFLTPGLSIADMDMWFHEYILGNVRIGCTCVETTRVNASSF